MRRIWILGLLCGCGLYWDGHGDDVCNGSSLSPPAELVRDPSTGQCETIGGGSCPCGEFCQTAKEPIHVAWPACHGACDGLAEATCLSTAGCHAEYQARADRGAPDFVSCWNLAPDAQQTGLCAGLSADDCAGHDNCASLMTQTAAGGDAFASCIAEPPPLCLVDMDCPSGESCDTTTCHQAPCPACPTCGACPATCFGVCAAVPCAQLATETACVDRPDCTAVYAGTNCTCDIHGNCTCQDVMYERCDGKL